MAKYLMKHLILLFAALSISACSADEPKIKIKLKSNNPALTASQYINYSESTHRTELKELMAVDPKRMEWCAAFVNAVLDESGIQSNRTHKYPFTARAFLDWGIPVTEPQPGDLVIFPRGNQGWQGHVGFYLSTISINGVEYYHVLGGNQSNKVSIEMFRANKSLGIRRNLM
jgi:uncharacterized protein (TIGR02594 family)|tara:strand:- start:54 stop:569 length:516 start_codon:yes stop_codon:yes gene_type:complete